jgi:hypothetical protein
MTEMVERVAKGLEAACGEQMGCNSDRCCCWGADQVMQCMMGVSLGALARAAIEAMREPTEGMIKAGAPHHWEGPNDIYADAEDAWRAMIAAALATEKVA